MFEGDLTTLSTADLLESAAEHRAEGNRRETRLLEHALVYGDRHHPDAHTVRPGRRSCDGRERAVVLGGEGCPAIMEFAVAEFGVLLGISPGVAADYIGNALGLRHRFPFTWARVLAGDATAWKACRIVTECSTLSEDAAGYVDRRVARIVDTVTPYRLEKIVKAAKFHADAALARAEAEEKARERGVFVGRSDEHGTKTIYIKAAAGAVIRFDATIAGIAEALQVLGDTRSAQARRAAAIGIIADSRYTEELLTQARKHRLTATAETTTVPDAATIGAAGGATTNDDSGAKRRAPAGATTSGHGGPMPSLHGDATTNVGGGAMQRVHGGATASVPGGAMPSVPGGAMRRVHGGATASVPGGDRAGLSAEAEPWCSRASLGDGWVRHGRVSVGGSVDDALLDNRWSHQAEPGPDDEADRDAPHPGSDDLPDPLDVPLEAIEPFDPDVCADPDNGEPMDADARRVLNTRLAQIKRDAHTRSATPAASGRASGPPGQTEIYVHLTDHTLSTGTGVVRAEGIGPLLADQLTELVGHGPYTVKPIIDLNDAVSVDAYEIPGRIRERVKLTHPVELFPFGNRESNRTIDLDHIQPYDPLGPPGQTSTQNLAPLGRFAHRVKTHGHGWKVRRLDHKTLEWTTPHGFVFHVDPTGTHRVRPPRR